MEPLVLEGVANMHPGDFMLEETGTRLLVEYSLRPKISVACAFREITLTKYIVKNINIYSI